MAVLVLRTSSLTYCTSQHFLSADGKDLVNVSVLKPQSVMTSRGERHLNNVFQQLVERGDFLFQQEVLLLCFFLPLLSDLQRCHQVSVLHIQVLQQPAQLCVLCQLQTRQTGSEVLVLQEVCGHR